MRYRSLILLLVLAASISTLGCNSSGTGSDKGTPGGAPPPGFESPKKKTAL